MRRGVPHGSDARLAEPPVVPRVVHYCWFGGNEPPAEMQECLASWHEALPGYTIKKWDESNFDVTQNRFLRDAYAMKGWAFVSDYARLKVLSEEGGIYLDTDVRVRRSFDPFLRHPLFLGFMFDCNLGTAVIGAAPGHPTIAAIRASYDEGRIPPGCINNDVFTTYFLEHVPGFRLDGRTRVLPDGTAVYAKEYFERPTWRRDAGYSVHELRGSWRTSDRPVHHRLAQRALGDVIYAKVAHRRAMRASSFYPTYLQHTAAGE